VTRDGEEDGPGRSKAMVRVCHHTKSAFILISLQKANELQTTTLRTGSWHLITLCYQVEQRKYYLRWMECKVPDNF
jgi:hypothetical protein